MTDRPKSFQGIMLSSTFTDLVEHRLRAKRAIEKLGFHAVGMESGGAQAADVIAVSLGYVRQSAAYIGIITKKYGQTPPDPDRNPDERSITELEFDEAMRLGRPILLFIMADDHRVLEEDIELDPVRREKLAAFKARAKRMHSDGQVERLWETFGSVEDFAEKVSHAVGNLAVDLALAEHITRSGPLTVPEMAVRGAITRFIDARPDAAEAELVQAVETFETGYRALQEQVAAIAIVDNRIASLKADAEQALHDGDLDTARRLYGEAAAAARERLTEPVRAMAQLLEAEAGAHLLALDWEAADKAWGDATAMLIPFDLAAGETITWKAASALQIHGERFARGGALRASIDRWRSLAEAAAARDEAARAADFQNNLGNVLTLLGEHTGGKAGLALLADAVTAYRATLTVHTESTGPTQWAMTQSNLSNALKLRGERTRGEAGLALLADAVAACRAALTIYTEAAMPDDWAMTQNNLGNALERQGERTRGEAGLALLADAVAAYRATFTIYTEAAMPNDWAMTQNNLGIALMTQGERTGGEAGLALLADAVRAFRAALTIYSEVAMPANWAITQDNLAVAYESIADLGRDSPKNLSIAETALCDALRVYTPEHMSYYHEQATRSLARIRKKLAALGD